MYTSLALSAITFLSHLWTKWCEMLWYIKYICESSATGVCFPGFYMVLFNALVKKAKKILAFCLLERLDGQTIKQWVATDHQTCSCQWHSVPGWQIIYHDCHKNTVISAALVSCTYSTALECQGWTHTALQRSCPLPKRVWDGWQQVSWVQILTENRQNHPRIQAVLLLCSRNTLLLGQSTNQNVTIQKITSSCTLI